MATVFSALQQMQLRLEDGKGHISGLMESLRIINHSRDSYTIKGEVGRVIHHLDAIFRLHHITYQDVVTLQAIMRDYDIPLERERGR